ncbi:LAME_0E02058g1_1 [Lachancea meyersii CBS 8951]|uniref:LAME_0E02058g1_1 n=1 Tax=Lachancea meyersii CBS 8951 TaxID=1266667 RepID=A0A1G4JG47_9SACH|nr:LAME_0E02058g1_1 [Lachancea meyersii CBS 8951]
MPSNTPDENKLAQEHSPLYKWNSCGPLLNPPQHLSRRQIRKIHIYDFDNTLFKSPAPNPNLLSSFLSNLLTDPQRFSNGGWWSEPRFLLELINEWIEARNGKLSDTERDAIDGMYWNEDVVKLTRLSQQSPDTLSILMTGRKESLFVKALMRVLDEPVFGEKRLQFHGVFLKKSGYDTTMLYKTSCLTDVLMHYSCCEEITIYDDRVRQLRGFRQFLSEFVEAICPSLQYTLIHVPGLVKYLRPAEERSIISSIFKEHNDAVTDAIFQLPSAANPRTFYMGKMYLKEKRLSAAYIITTQSRQKLVGFVAKKLAHSINLDETHISARYIMCTQHGTITSRKIATMILMGSQEEPSDETVNKYMHCMNSGTENSRIQLRVTSLGVAPNGHCVCDVRPEFETRFIYTEFSALRISLTAPNNETIDTGPELYNDELYAWEAVENDKLIIDADFGYRFVLTGVMAKKTKKLRKIRN